MGDDVAPRREFIEQNVLGLELLSLRSGWLVADVKVVISDKNPGPVGQKGWHLRTPSRR